ncbi:MAG: hypothetical protein ABIQ31_25435 [Ferruginibacter sp.]
MKKLNTSLQFYCLVAALSFTGMLGCTSAKYVAKSFMFSSEAKIAAPEYSTYLSFPEIISAKDAKYPSVKRITDGGTKKKPVYNGFFFYNCSPLDLSQFDPSGRYLLNMQVTIEGREVRATDKGDIGMIDLKNNNQWIRVGQTTAWNWQQGCRLEWIPGSSEEFIWDDRSDDGKSFVSRIYNIRTGKTRTLPRPIYTISPDGVTALTHDFERMEHGGTNFVGIEDKYKRQWAPEETGVFKMDLRTGKSVMIVSVRQMARILYPGKLPADTAGGRLYIFREGFNVSGNRFIAFVKDVRIKSPGDTTTRTIGFSMTPEGQDIRYLYEEPSHHYWRDDSTIIDNVRVQLPSGGDRVRAYILFKDDGSGKPKEILWVAPNGHDSYHKSGEWILTDTYSTDGKYNLNGYHYLYMYHIATKKFVPLGKFEFRINGTYSKEDPGIFRVDLHPRFSPDGRLISFDSTHEGLGRQVYMIDIGYILDNPPMAN